MRLVPAFLLVASLVLASCDRERPTNPLAEEIGRNCAVAVPSPASPVWVADFEAQFVALVGPRQEIDSYARHYRRLAAGERPDVPGENRVLGEFRSCHFGGLPPGVYFDVPPSEAYREWETTVCSGATHAVYDLDKRTIVDMPCRAR